MRRLIAVGLVCLLAVSCGDGGSGEQEGYVDAIAVSLASGDPTAINLPRDEARCVATKWVATIGVDRFKTKGIEPGDIGNGPSRVGLAVIGFSQADGHEMYDAFAACQVDIEQAIVAASGLGNQGRRCLTDAVDDDFLREFMVATITNPDAGAAPPSDVDRDFEEILERCNREEQNG